MSKTNNGKLKINRRMPSVFYLTVFIFIVSCITATFLITIYVGLINAGLNKEWDIISIGVALLIGSIIVSTFLVRGFGNKIIFGSLKQINDASKAVAAGDFSQRLQIPKEKETAEICENFNEMVNKLGNNELLARDFVSNVSHQFRNPLSSIHGYVQLLESKNISEEEKSEYISIIKEKSIELTELVNDILELSRIEHQSGALIKEKFYIDEQIRKCILNSKAAQKNKNIEFDLDLENVEFFGNAELLKEVWNNIIDNAIKFSDNDGVIRIELRQITNKAVVKIIDNGIGMSEETLNRLYERFYRGKEAYSYDGSGLGMSMVKSVLDKHNGVINVSSQIGKGTAFTIELPNV